MLNYSVKDFAKLLHETGRIFVRDVLCGNDEEPNWSSSSDGSLSDHSSEEDLTDE
jgi:hypothetical protein